MDINIDYGSEVKQITLSDQIVDAIYPNTSNGEAVARAVEAIKVRVLILLVDAGLSIPEAVALVASQITEKD